MTTLEFAVQMELDGERFYKEQADINKNNSLSVVCNLLAEDEKVHAQILENKRKELSYELKDSAILKRTSNVFKDVADIKLPEKEIVTQLDFYRIASKTELESITMYEQLRDQADLPVEKELYEFLIQQEKNHREVLENFNILLTRPEEWVESAEFGIREDY